MNWIDGDIEGVGLEPLNRFEDERGWLAEIFRSDELTENQFPEMGYLSVTQPGTARGPHEHVHQTDRFAFFHGSYSLFLWDSRPSSPSTGCRAVINVGEDNPSIVTIPPGVVHAYRNESSFPAFVLNFPDKLYAGEGKRDPVDEIRHEDNVDHQDRQDSIYQM